MRILHINGPYFAEGGAETYLRPLADSQRAARHEVHLLYASDPPTKRPCGEHVQFIAPSHGIRTGIRHKGEFLDAVNRLHPDVIHCHVVQYTVSPLILTPLSRSYPTVYSVHDTLAFCLKEPSEDPDAPPPRLLPSGAPCLEPVGRPCARHGCLHQLVATRGWPGSLKRILEDAWRRRALRRFARFVVNSGFTRDELVRNGFAPERIDVITPPLSMPGIWGRPQARTARTEATILFVGYLAPIKGVFLLLDALAKIRRLSWRAELVGEGPARSRLEKKVSSLGLEGRVDFKGRVDREHLGEIYREADLLVFPSLAPESWGFVGIEAMYFGLPVVSFGIGATREWLAHGESGMIVKAGDVDALADALAMLVGDRPLLQRLGEGARGRALEFLGSRAEFAKHVEAVYAKTIAGWAPERRG